MSIRSIHAGFSGLLKHVGTLIKVFRQFMSQRFFTEFSPIPTIKISYENEIIIGFAMLINEAV